jgi:hypothetical protein
MPLSFAEQQTIEKIAAAANPDQRNALRLQAEAALTQISKRRARRLLFLEENQAAERAIELLVRTEAVGESKGWWFRLKRRLQLKHIYLDVTPKPFGPSVETEVDEDALKLMTLIDVALTRYLPMSEDELMAALPADFTPDHYSFDLDALTFVFPTLPNFYFTLSENMGSISLCVTGRRYYTGFTLFVPAHGRWHCSSGGAASDPGRSGTSALAQLIERKFGIRDISSTLEDI